MRGWGRWGRGQVAVRMAWRGGRRSSSGREGWSQSLEGEAKAAKGAVWDKVGLWCGRGEVKDTCVKQVGGGREGRVESLSRVEGGASVVKNVCCKEDPGGGGGCGRWVGGGKGLMRCPTQGRDPVDSRIKPSVMTCRIHLPGTTNPAELGNLRPP